MPDADRRSREGLRLLARMIARDYLAEMRGDTRVVSTPVGRRTGWEPAHGDGETNKGEERHHDL